MKNDFDENALLSISPITEDHHALKHILRQYSSGKKNYFKVLTCSSLDWGMKLLRRQQIPVANCESNLQDRSWKYLLEQTLTMAHMPLLIVTSRLADERLWAEVLNLGGWDVLNDQSRTEFAVHLLSDWSVLAG